MDSSMIIARLRDYEGELKAAEIEHLSLHGSCARGTAIGGASDVDIIADFDRAKKLSLLGPSAAGAPLVAYIGTFGRMWPFRFGAEDIMETFGNL